MSDNELIDVLMEGAALLEHIDYGTCMQLIVDAIMVEAHGARIAVKSGRLSNTALDYIARRGSEVRP